MAVRVWVDEEENLRLAAKGFRFTHPNFGQLKQELKGGQHWLIVDMDSHFEDPALDFRNLYVS